MSTNIEARMIIEIMGRPPEHVTKAIELIIQKLEQEKGVTVKSKKIHEPVPVQDAQNLFSSFTEIELVFDSIPTYLGIMFAYLPSNIEIISPKEFKIKNEDLTVWGNNIISRIHTYDAIAKRLVGEREILMRKLQELTGNKETKDNKTNSESKSAENKKPNKKGKKKTK